MTFQVADSASSNSGCREATTQLWLASVGRAVTGSRVLSSVGGRSLCLSKGPGSAVTTSISDRSALVFDGCLHERNELAASLAVNSNLGDADLVRIAHERWGEACASRLAGDFAFCLLDLSSGYVLAARDRVGNYPLFYLESADGIRFSTSVDAFAEFGIGSELDPVSLAIYAVSGDLQQRTLERGVVRLPVGHLVRFDEHGARTGRYWHLPAVGDGAEWVAEDELPGFDRLLAKVVGRAVGDGPVGLFLSGGLDSAAIALMAVDAARARRQPPPRALSLHMPGPLDEREIQRAVAHRLGMPQTTLQTMESGIDGLVDDALALSASRPAPLQNIWLPATERLARLAREQGCRVLIGGSGGDEWLGVSPLVAAEQLKSLDLIGVLRTATAFGSSNDVHWLFALRHVLWRSALRPVLSDFASTSRRVDTPSPPLPDWAVPDPLLRGEMTEQYGVRRSSGNSSSRYFEQVRRTIEHPQTLADREESFESGRRLGIRYANTYWDPELIEFLYRVPPHLLDQGGRSKALIRRVVARRLPGLGFDRQRKLEWTGDSILPPAVRFAWRRLGGVPALAGIGVVDGRRFAAHLDDVLARGDGRAVASAWRTLCLESWVRPRV